MPKYIPTTSNPASEISLRDHIATQVLSRLIKSNNYDLIYAEPEAQAKLSKAIYRMTDALLEARGGRG